ncbi:hypothetical protein K501DRAFT_271157 [Backusella circina FSU 941]|nr:hypothetical protein K501DRAFT_271157 [Backusella circina FSU 941]
MNYITYTVLLWKVTHTVWVTKRLLFVAGHVVRGERQVGSSLFCILKSIRWVLSILIMLTNRNKEQYYQDGNYIYIHVHTFGIAIYGFSIKLTHIPIRKICSYRLPFSALERLCL